MISLKVIFAILLLHWVTDFLLQTDWQAKNKAKDINALLEHTVTYSLTWWIAMALFFPLVPVLLFVLITFVFHTATDYFTSKLNAKLYKEGKTHLFFVSIGFDQILHYAQLILTYYLIIK